MSTCIRNELARLSGCECGIRGAGLVLLISGGPWSLCDCSYCSKAINPSISKSSVSSSLPLVSILLVNTPPSGGLVDLFLFLCDRTGADPLPIEPPPLLEYTNCPFLLAIRREPKNPLPCTLLHALRLFYEPHPVGAVTRSNDGCLQIFIQ